VAQFSFADIVAESPSMSETVRRAREFAPTDGTVMITGETGTGKELLAQGLHNASARKAGPFVAVNCAAIPVSLLESELFGYEEGAFTGARRGGKKGYFELAHSGTLFLDEIGELPPDVQVRLLRALQERSIMRIGGDQIIPVDVRIVAATHRDIEAAVQGGSFRRDLYYRLNVLRLHVPPLRARTEDMRPLVELIVERIARQRGRPRPVLRPECFRALSAHSWPGNVRELENVLERLVVLSRGPSVSAAGVRDLLREDSVSRGIEAGISSVSQERIGSLAEIEWRIIQETLRRVHGNKAEACRLLGISRPTLWRRMNAATSSKRIGNRKEQLVHRQQRGVSD
jgi:transcriptional regulator with PAS, ATPase and Fis domain